AEIYDPATGPATGHWTPTGAMTQARGSHTATLLASGRVLVSGGTLDFGTPLASAELYDPVSGTWAPTGSLGTARWYHTATRLPAGQVLAAGGNNVDQSFQSTEVYDGTRSAIADFGSAQIDDSALFSFTDPRRPLAFPFGGCPLDLRRSDSSGFWTLFAHAADGPDPCPPRPSFETPPRSSSPISVTTGHSSG
ncbi:MAG: kelch repeat-containing protein, partial [bacterium]